MGFAQYNIQFLVPAGSYGVLVEYREATEGSDWIAPTNPGNPTMVSPYPLLLEEGKSYYIGTTSIGLTCAQSRRIIGPITVPAAENCCPSTYTLSVDGTYCYKYDDTVATPPSSPLSTVAKTAVQYSTCGSYIYDPGYLLDGTGTSTQISLSNPFWKNGGTCADNNFTDGPMNRSALWATSTTDDQDIGFSVCVSVATTKTYYVGLGCDNYAKIYLDGNPVVIQDETSLGAQYSVGPAATFKVWHIYPVQITAGDHTLELIGHNVISIAALGAEIYDNTAAQIRSATSYSGLNLVFSTKDYRGQPVQIGSGGVGYSCPDGYGLVACNDPFICRRILTTAVIPC